MQYALSLQIGVASDEERLVWRDDRSKCVLATRRVAQSAIVGMALARERRSVTESKSYTRWTRK
jgi:hypothetical protein